MRAYVVHRIQNVKRHSAPSSDIRWRRVAVGSVMRRLRAAGNAVVENRTVARRRQVYAARVDLAALPSPDDAEPVIGRAFARPVGIAGRTMRPVPMPASSFETLAGASSSGRGDKADYDAAKMGGLPSRRRADGVQEIVDIALQRNRLLLKRCRSPERVF